jgi:hypothetical protein
LQEVLKSVKPKHVPRYTIKVLMCVETAYESWTEEWWIRTGVGNGPAWKMAVAEDLAADSDWVLWPTSQVACRIGGNSKPGRALTEGKAFATLSTGILTGFVLLLSRCCLFSSHGMLFLVVA